MWELAEQDASRGRRIALIEAQHSRQRVRGLGPLALAQRVASAARHCSSSSDAKRFVTPPLELFCQDVRGRELLEEISLEDLEISSDWLAVIAAHASALGAALTSRCKRFVLAGTSATDASVAHLNKFKQLAVLDLSRCTLLTDVALHNIRRQLSLLQELHISECRHFTTPALCQLWRDCSRLHALTARACPAVTDSFLQCVATTKRASSTLLLTHLDVRQCKHVTSSGVSYIATSSLVGLAISSLRVGDCLEVDNMAFFGFETSAGLRRLRTLSLSGLAVDETAVSWIAKGCTALERLDLSRCRVLTDFALLLLAPLVQRSGCLVELNLKACPLLTDAGIRNLFAVAKDAKKQQLLDRKAASGSATSNSHLDSHEVDEDDEDDDDDSNCSPLTTLNLKDCALLGDAAIEVVSRHCAHLVKLSAKGLRKLSDRSVRALCRRCPRLATLKLSGRYVSTQSFELLGKLLRQLDALDVSERQDLDSSLCILQLTAPRAKAAALSSSLAGAHQSLRKLNLSATNVCDVGVSMLAVHCRQLEWLNLSKCTRLTDAAIEALAACAFELRVLLLASVKGVTDRSLYACAATQLPLHTLDLSSNTNITDAGVLALCAACEQLRELRLKGCDRVAHATVARCSTQLLPFTRALAAPTLAYKLATGSASSSMALTSLPPRHVALLQTMVERYDAACALQTAFRHRQQRETSLLALARRRCQRESRAAVKIQRCARAWLTWRGYLRWLALEANAPLIVRVQAHVRGNACRWRQRIAAYIAHRSARVIQRWCRPILHATLALRHERACTIQRVYRGYRDRIAVRCLVLERQCAARDRIWRWYRRCWHTRDVRTRTRWLLQQVRAIQRQWRAYACRGRFTRCLAGYHALATCIQRYWRGVLARMYVKQRRVAMHSAALVLQRVYRGHCARTYVRLLRVRIQAAATCIQRYWHRHSAVQQYARKRRCIIHVQQLVRYAHAVRCWRRVLALAVEQRRGEAAVVIQRVSRGWRGRRRARLFRKIRNAKLARKGQNARHALVRRSLLQRGAIVLLQQWVRRVQLRRRMLLVRKWRRTVAARRLQRYWRAWLQTLRRRQTREAKTHAAVHVQRTFRGWRGRCAFATERRRQQQLCATLVIQRVYRGYRGRCLYRRERRDKTRAALLLQRAFRSRHARTLVAISQAMVALKAKDAYEHSVRGWIDAKRNPMDELYRRAKLPRERAELLALRAKWEANRVAEQRAVRKLRLQARAAWTDAREPIGNYFALQRKLYGVTENVYTSRREFDERKTRNTELTHALVDCHARIAAFRAALLDASASQRMLDGDDVFALLRAHGLTAPSAAVAAADRQRSSNQHDDDD